jgi:lactoylglutathione lyase
VFSHVFVGVKDFERAFAFYSSLMDALGHAPRFCDRARPWAGWQPGSGGRPLFLIGAPHDGMAHAPGNGQMTAFAVDRRATVDGAYRLALDSGATSEGSPALRPHYHAHYYGAYLRDPEGNKFCIVCHADEPVA